MNRLRQALLLGITLIGRLRFNDLESANHVAHANDYLFIASDLGGVKLA